MTMTRVKEPERENKMAEVEMIQYRDDDGWTCLMYRAYNTKTPSEPFLRVLIHDDLGLWSTNMTAVRGEISKQACKNNIAIAKEMRARNVFTERVRRYELERSER